MLVYQIKNVVRTIFYLLVYTFRVALSLFQVRNGWELFKAR